MKTSLKTALTGVAMIIGLGMAPAYAGDWRDNARWEIRVSNHDFRPHHAPAYRTEAYAPPHKKHHRHVKKHRHERQCENRPRYGGYGRR
ncbi:MAG: hypothetical protein ACFCUJ_16130 [Thiotrichales bacterium]